MNSQLLLIGVLLVAIAIPAKAQVQVAEQRVRDTVATLNVDVPANWNFWVVSEPEWESEKKHFGSQSNTAFSVIAMHLTVVRGSYVVNSTDAQLRGTLAHEFGHVLCWCTSETGANRAAQLIMKKRTVTPEQLHFDSMPPR